MPNEIFWLKDGRARDVGKKRIESLICCVLNCGQPGRVWVTRINPHKFEIKIDGHPVIIRSEDDGKTWQDDCSKEEIITLVKDVVDYLNKRFERRYYTAKHKPVGLAPRPSRAIDEYS